jgi:hypothetical protein
VKELRVRHFVTGLILVLVTAHYSRADAPGYEITSTLQGSQLVTTASSEGMIAEHFSDPAHPQTMTRRYIVRYQDQSLWGIDGEHRTYFKTSVAAKCESARASLDHVRASSPPDTKEKALNALASLTSLSLKDRIDGIAVEAFSLVMPGQSWRLWIATSLKRPPADIRASIAQLVPVDAASLGLLAKIAGYPVLRSEFKNGTDWKIVLDTQKVRRIVMKSSDLAPPTDFRLTASISGGPGSQFPMPPGGMDVPAHVVRGPGPEMSNPEVYVVVWGAKLNDPANKVGQGEIVSSLADMVRPQYTNALAQYDINSSKVEGVYHRSDLPPRAVGSSNFAAISAIVYDVGFNDGAPIFWWEVGGHDPLYVVLVIDSEVDNSGWNGYHFVAFSLTHAVLPFPVSLFAHDAIPWLISRMPDGALNMPVEGRLHRSECALVPRPAGIDAACSAMPLFNTATESISHEFVETVSDPYVFMGWSDPGQQPFYKKSELADICEFNPSPWASSSVVGLTSVATYWSNTDNGCVPESRPSLTVFDPAAGAVISSASGHAVLHGFAEDPVDGDISKQITWAVDGTSKGNGATADSGALTAGSHLVTALIQDSRGLQRTVQHGFSVNSSPHKVTILSPTAASQYANNQQIVFRGQAFVFQPGDISESAIQWDDGGKVLGNGEVLFQALPDIGDHNIRLSVIGAGGQPVASTNETIHIVAAPSKRRAPSVMITSPAGGGVLFVPYGQDHSAPILFTATVTDGNGLPVSAVVSWKSDLDGQLGSGVTLSHSLHGGYCAPSIHKITVTAFNPLGGVASDSILITVGEVC